MDERIARETAVRVSRTRSLKGETREVEARGHKTLTKDGDRVIMSPWTLREFVTEVMRETKAMGFPLGFSVWARWEGDDEFSLSVRLHDDVRGRE